MVDRLFGPPVPRHEQQATLRKMADACAAAVWPHMDDEERAVVRFGMIPKDVADAVGEIAKIGPTECPHQKRFQIDDVIVVHGVTSENHADFHRFFAVALMGEAEKDGGMIA